MKKILLVPLALVLGCSTIAQDLGLRMSDPRAQLAKDVVRCAADDRDPEQILKCLGHDASGSSIEVEAHAVTTCADKLNTASELGTDAAVSAALDELDAVLELVD